MKEKLKEQWITVVAVCFIFILGIIYGIVGGTWGILGIGIAFILGILLVLSSFGIYKFTHTELVLGELRKQISIFRDVYLFLAPDDVLKEIERKANEIWVMTPDLYYELQEPEWQRLVYENIERGAQYTYFIQEDLKSEFDKHLTEAQRFLMAKGKSIGENQIVAKFVKIVVPTEVVIYNPNDNAGRAYVVTPVEGAKTNMKMDASVRNRVISLLRQCK